VRQDSLVSLTHADLEITADWEKREYTTDPPRYIPYSVWSLRFGVICKVPIRVVRLLTSGGVARWGMDGGHEKSARRSLVARFHPNDWLHSDEVHVSFGSAVWVKDTDLKLDPRPLVQVHESHPVTGDSVTLAEIPRLGIRFEIIAFAHGDTEDRRRSRWRVRPRHEQQLPSQLQGLTSGYQSGEARL
jgi:hypothetical protein